MCIRDRHGSDITPERFDIELQNVSFAYGREDVLHDITTVSYTHLDVYKRQLMDIAARSLKTKRTVITKLLENGLYPYTKRYLGSFENHFSTIGDVYKRQAHRSFYGR